MSRQLFLEPTTYDYDRTGEPIQTLASNGDVIIEKKILASSLVNEGRSQYTLETPLHSVVKDFSRCIPEGVGARALAYINNVQVTGTSNNSPFTFNAGFSELTKSTLQFINAQKKGAIPPKHMRRVNSDEPIYNFQVPTTTHLFEEGHPARDALEDIDLSGEAYTHFTSDNIQPATPHAKSFAFMIAKYKGVTQGSLDSTIFPDKDNRHIVRVPANSLMAEHIDTQAHSIIYRGEGNFSCDQDLFIVMTKKDAMVTAMKILAQAKRVQEACVRDIRNLSLNLAACVDRNDWYFDTDQERIVNKRTNQTFSPDHEFTIRMRINFNSLFVAYKSNSVSLTHNGKGIPFPRVYSVKDMKNGRLKPSAKPIYVLRTAMRAEATSSSSSFSSSDGSTSKKRRAQETTVSSSSSEVEEEEESSSSKAASSSAVEDD